MFPPVFQTKKGGVVLIVNLEQKKKIVDALHQKFSDAKVVIVTDYKGLDVSAINSLRRKLREADIEYKVVKNTLLIRASEDTDVALIRESFTGPSAIALSYDDPVAPAKIFSDFTKEHKALEVKVGVMGGKVLDLAAIKTLSALPSREVLLAKLLSVANGVPTAFVRVLNGIPGQLLNVLTAVKEKKEAA
jgi:large subunit ribosomal protein L10